MASLINRNGRYYAQWKDAERIPQHRRLSLATRNRRVVEQLLNELDAAFKLGTWDPWLQTIDEFHDRPQEIRAVSDVLGRFLETKRLEGLPNETLKSYSSALNRFARSVGRTTYLERITEQEVARFSFKASLARSTQRLRHRIVRAFLNWSEREGYLKDNPIGRVQPPRPVEQLPRIVRPADLESLCETLRKDYREKLHADCDTVRGACREGDLIWTIPLFWFALYTGMRISELARLRWKHIDTKKRLIYIHKRRTGRHRPYRLRQWLLLFWKR